MREKHAKNPIHWIYNQKNHQKYRKNENIQLA